MLTRTNIDRLDLSERVISDWEATGGPPGTPAELLRLIDAECNMLEELSPADPERVNDLLTRYRALAAQLRLQIT